MKVLVTGGAGYIGSFIVRQLKRENNDVVILDNLSDGHKKAVEGFELKEIDLLLEKGKLDRLFKKEKFDAVIHMASLIQVGDSFKNPYKYFYQNLGNALNLFDAMVKSGTKYIVFSSSAAVYGTPTKLPIEEEDPKKPENPYGETKLMIERFLKWFEATHDIKSISLRYFNAAGAAPDGSIGEDHPNESHLIPLAITHAMNGKSFTIFGGDYDTPDGTNVRDYVHVADLAKAHTLALKKLSEGGASNSYNVGIGRGYSNKQVVDEIRRITNLTFGIKVGDRRKGDPPSLYASNDKIKKDLGWKPQYKLSDIVKHAYKWHKSHPNGYDE